MILIVDYGLGNLRSAQKAFEHVGHAARISDTPSDVARADAVVLPGVGAFGDCYEGLRSAGFVAPLLEAVAGGKPFFSASREQGLLPSDLRANICRTPPRSSSHGVVRENLLSFLAGATTRRATCTSPAGANNTKRAA